MKKKDYSEVNGRSAEEICSKIRDESAEEEAIILERAHKERERLLSAADKDAAKEASAILAEADKEVERARERIFSTLNLEKKKIVLSEKDRFIEEVLSDAKKEAGNFRSDRGYPAFLKKAVLEGLEVVDNPAIEVLYSERDGDIINSAFINDLKESAGTGTKKDIKMDFTGASFADIGVMVRSADGRLFFDNRFSARLKRAYEEIYMELLKETF